MTVKNSGSRYSPWVIGLHWLMLLQLIAVYAFINLHDLAPKGTDLRDTLKSLHFLFGLTVLPFVAVRIGLRWSAGAAPGIRPPPPRWQARIAALVHYALYAFMIITPILGWLTLSAAGKPILLFGIDMPPLIAANEMLSDQLEEVHETFGTAGYYLIGLHAAAALVHHYFYRDNTLLRMLPGR